jgi:hypothetical protein
MASQRTMLITARQEYFFSSKKNKKMNLQDLLLHGVTAYDADYGSLRRRSALLTYVADVC